MKSYIISFIFILTLINGVFYAIDLFAIGKSYRYVPTCSDERTFSILLGKGWGCNQNHEEMMRCFDAWKDENNYSTECKLARTFPMKFYHVHRWLQYLFDPVWHHPYQILPQKHVVDFGKKSR